MVYFPPVPSHLRLGNSRYTDIGWTEYGRWGNQGSGILFTTGEQVLLLQRSREVEEPGTWGIPGGAIPQTSTGKFMDPLSSARREVREEMSKVPAHTIIDKHIYREPKFQYTTFLAQVNPRKALAFRPSLNWENDYYGWFTEGELEELDLHFGVAEALNHLDPFY